MGDPPPELSKPKDVSWDSERTGSGAKMLALEEARGEVW